MAKAANKTRMVFADDEAMRKAISAARVVAIDTETTGLDAYTDALLGVSIACADPGDPSITLGKYWSFDRAGPPGSFCDWDNIREAILEPLFKRRSVVLVMHNAAFDYHVFAARGLKIQNKLRDTQILAFYHDENDLASLKMLAAKYLGHKTLTYKQTQAKMRSFISDAEKDIKKKTSEAWDHYKEHRKTSSVEKPNLASIPDSWPLHIRVAHKLPPKVLKTDVVAAVDEAIRPGILSEAKKAQYRQFDEYATLDAVYTYDLYRLFWRRLREMSKEDNTDYFDLIDTMELPCAILTGEMKRDGVYIDKKKLVTIDLALGWAEEEVAREVAEAFGADFNAGSSKQLKELLWRDRKLPAPKWAKIGEDGMPSTNADVMDWLADKGFAEAQLILRYRGVKKVRSTYTQALLRSLTPDSRVKTSFNSLGAASGRWSCSDPVNLQNQPNAYKMPKVVVPRGEDAENPWPGFLPVESSRGKSGKPSQWIVEPLRKVYTEEDGWSLVSRDYSQVELRVMAHVSRDPALMEAYTRWDCAECGGSGHTNKPLHACPQCGAPEGKRDKMNPDQPAISGFCLGLDIHSRTAVKTPLIKIFGSLEAARPHAKTVNFGLLYGTGHKSLARDLGISEAEAKAVWEGYFAEYSGVRRYHQSIEHMMRTQGWVPIASGRRRRFTKEHNLWRAGKISDFKFSGSIRTAYNAPIQGLAGDVMKVALVNLRRRLRRERPGEHRFLMQVHDEVLLSAPDSVVESVSEATQHEMENAVELSVPIITDGSFGKGSWHDYH